MKPLLPDEQPCQLDKDFPTLKFEIMDVDGIKRQFDLESERYIAISEEENSNLLLDEFDVYNDVQRKSKNYF